jgi:DNA-binding response OmpR family regulator
MREAIRARVEGCSESLLCVEAVGGVDAIEQAEKRKPDLIVLDLAMPRMNGVEAASVLKGMMPQVQIIVFTLYAQFLGKSLASSAGIDAVFAKPDEIGKVLACVRALLERRARSKSVGN